MGSFKIYGIWPQARKAINHTDMCNAVPLVWGSLGLTPINNNIWTIFLNPNIMKSSIYTYPKTALKGHPTSALTAVAKMASWKEMDW